MDHAARIERIKKMPDSPMKTRMLKFAEEQAVKAKDDLTPVGAEDPERAIALKKHEEGITVSQDLRPVGDDFQKLLVNGKEKTVADVRGAVLSWINKNKLSVSADAVTRDVLKGQNVRVANNSISLIKDVASVGDASVKIDLFVDGKYAASTNRSTTVTEAVAGWIAAHPEDKGKKVTGRKDAKARDTELPVPIKPVGLVPMPAGENNEESYAPHRVAMDSEKTYHVPIEGKTYVVRAASEKAAKALAQMQHSQAGLGKDRKAKDAEEDEHGFVDPAQRKLPEYRAWEAAKSRFVATKSKSDFALLREAKNVLVDASKKARKTKAKDARSQWQPDSVNHDKLDHLHTEVTSAGYKHKYTAGGSANGKPLQGVMQHVYRKGGNEATRPTAIISERKSGNHDVTYRPGTAKALDANGLTSSEVSELAKLKAKRQAGAELSDKEKVRYAKLNAVRATDAKAILPLQSSGSAPADHLNRAMQYEIGNDRARALDSYRAAASGFRKANDAAGEAKARDGIKHCQSVGYDMQYDHPGAGRVRVCDSAESALRTALERTRSGEHVHVAGLKVMPGLKSRAKDAEDYDMDLSYAESEVEDAEEELYDVMLDTKSTAAQKQKAKATLQSAQIDLRRIKSRAKDTQAGLSYSDKSKCPTCAGVGERTTGNKCVTCNGTGKVTIAAKDAGAFKKLEGELSKEKGVADPAALAASIGRKKYGAEGMTKKAAGKDAVPHKFAPMPGNRKNQPCNKCLEYKSHSNHSTEAIKDYEKSKAKDVRPV